MEIYLQSDICANGLHTDNFILLNLNLLYVQVCGQQIARQSILL